MDFTFRTTVSAPWGTDFSHVPYGFLWMVIYRWFPIITNELFAYNFVLLSSFVLSGFFMYLLAYFITKNHLASFISGLIYSFCPYHFQRSWEHFSLAQIQWIPLYLLALFKLQKDFNWKSILLFVVASSFILQMEINYVLIVGICTFFYFVFIFLRNVSLNLLSHKRNVHSFVNELSVEIKSFFKFFLSGIVVILINFTFIWSVVRALFISPEASAATADLGQRSFHYLFSQSARFLNYIIPSSSNPFLGGLARSLEGSIFYGRSPIEQTLYLGWIPIILSFVAWKTKSKTLGSSDSKQKIPFFVGLFGFLAISGFLFSLPPTFGFGSFKIYSPSFFMYKFLPMFRAYARFGLLVICSISVLAGVGFHFFCKRFKSNRVVAFFSIVIISIILFEFNNVPPVRITDLSNPPQVYAWLAEQEGDFIVAEYPLGDPSPGETYVELDYLLYQRYHRKRLLNGVLPDTQAHSIVQQVFKIADRNTPKILRSLEVRYAIVHLDRYRDGTNKKAVDIVGELPDMSRSKGLKLIKKFGDDEIYQVTVQK
ncbi:hypothetical protein ACFL96_10220 [Thermoproteota archaeon]